VGFWTEVVFKLLAGGSANKHLYSFDHFVQSLMVPTQIKVYGSVMLPKTFI